MKLYHYVHCPFCLRVRMVLGLFGIRYESIVLPYNDEKTPIDIMGVKMLPILTDGHFKTNESLEIIKHLDSNDVLKLRTLEGLEEFKQLENYLNQLGSNVHSLAMPYWIYTKEFDESSRKYFQEKKEIKRGPFSELVKRKEEFILALQKDLKELENQLNPFYGASTLRIYDIMIASHLWGMYVVPEFQFSTKIHDYLQKVGKECHFDYHKDFWS